MPKTESLSRSDILGKTSLYAKWAPAQLKAFSKLAEVTFSDGALSVKEKELIAVACAHVLRCEYCIDYHIKLAKEADVSIEETSEAIWVGVVMGASACFRHSSVAFETLLGDSSISHDGEHSRHLNRFAEETPTISSAYSEFHRAATSAGVLSRGIKCLIAIACAHNTRCSHCIEHHVNEALDLGLSREEISEAIWVAVEMAAGAGLSHAGLSAVLLE
jgi:AhpD family alkylhydroperoxidase